MVDARPSSGLGHLVRSVALAHAVALRGAQITLVLDGMAAALADVGVARSWSTVSTDTPAAAVAEWAMAPGRKVVVVDDPRARDVAVRERQKGAVSVLAAFMDGEARGGPLDVAINVNAYADDIDHSILPSRCIRCFGPEYVCLRPSIRRASKATTTPGGTTVLVTLGGADPLGLTPTVVRALAPVLASRSSRTRVDVVVGPGSLQSEEVERARSAHGALDFVVHHRVGDLAPLMTRAELAISAGGGTLYELSFLGVPTIALPETKDEELNARAVERSGACISIIPNGNWVPGMQTAVAQLIESEERRRRMALAGRVLVDGNGPDRLADVLMRSAREA